MCIGRPEQNESDEFTVTVDLTALRQGILTDLEASPFWLGTLANELSRSIHLYLPVLELLFYAAKPGF